MPTTASLAACRTQLATAPHTSLAACRTQLSLYSESSQGGLGGSWLGASWESSWDPWARGPILHIMLILERGQNWVEVRLRECGWLLARSPLVKTGLSPVYISASFKPRAVGGRGSRRFRILDWFAKLTVWGLTLQLAHTDKIYRFEWPPIGPPLPHQ